MEEEFKENDLEEPMYAALHYIDESQPETNRKETTANFDNSQQSTLRRYWRTKENVTPYIKVNTPTNKIKTHSNKVKPNKKETENSASKSNENPLPKSGAELTLFLQPVPHNVKKTIEILETENKNWVVELETSDEDEVVEVALPSKPTITIDSSDEDDIQVSKKSTKENEALEVKPAQDRTCSPIPSSVSSISDEFIRSDCIALNISSQNHNHSTLDYSTLCSDIEQTPSKRRKKRKSKDATSTPISSKSAEADECFATPRSKAKNKKQRKSYQVSDISVPSADVYDSDSNQPTVDLNKSGNNYEVTDKSLPNADVYETDSNQSESIRGSPNKLKETGITDVDSTEHLSDKESQVSINPIKVPEQERQKNIVDLTENDSIQESIVMANVTGSSTSENKIEEDLATNHSPSKCGSTKIPAILYEDLDFDHLKGNKVFKKRKYSLTALRAEMEKFYNESWGGENFKHREIQKKMSRDKSLWVIDPKDRMPTLARRRTTCHFCNQVGHRDDACRLKTPICYMCGSTGHYEPRCPKKICVNCGLPNHIYTTMCRNCSTWNSITCAECGQNGHPSSHCPDVWRRYHNTINFNVPLQENRQIKKHHQLFCSGCTKRGHLVHTCRQSLPFTGLSIYSPYVMVYRPVYCSTINESQTNDSQANNNKNRQQKKINLVINTPKSDRNKRQSKSPIAKEFMNKKRNLGYTDDPKNNLNSQQKKENKDSKTDSNVEIKNTNKPEKKDTHTENNADFIDVSSINHDEKGQIIQDNEVSDTSEAITSARIYITSGICESFETADREEWLKQASTKNNITIDNTENNFFISIKGSVGNQEAFQSELRDWIKSKQPVKEHRVSESDANCSVESINQPEPSDNIPKKKNSVLRILNKALVSLKADIGDPKAMYKELVFLQNRQKQLMNQHVISPKQLSNNRCNINSILKKLNMVLLGQAGLADGSKHLSELYLLHEKVTNLRNKTISTELRKEIGQHFHCIFAAIQRDDLADLLDKYYNKSPVQPVGKNKSKKLLKMTPSTNKKILNKKVNRKLSPTMIIGTDGGKNNQGLPEKINRLEKLRSQLITFHVRLRKMRPEDSYMKKARDQVMKELHYNIALLAYTEKLSRKDLINAIRLQSNANQLVTNIEMGYRSRN